MLAGVLLLGTGVLEKCADFGRGVLDGRVVEVVEGDVELVFEAGVHLDGLHSLLQLGD